MDADSNDISFLFWIVFRIFPCICFCHFFLLENICMDLVSSYFRLA